MSECQMKQCKEKGKIKPKDEPKKYPPHVHLKPINHQSDLVSTNYYGPDRAVAGYSYPQIEPVEVLHQFGQFKSGLEIKVMNKKHWRALLKCGAEMIITKSGRTMFPPIRVQLGGLLPDRLYMIVLEFKLVDYVRYKFNKDKQMWIPGKELSQDIQPSVNSRLIAYHPIQGSKLMGHELNFKNVKFSNEKSGEQIVFLKSMHKYCPRLWIIQCDDRINLEHSIQSLLRIYPSFSRDLEYSEFIATTAYQNREVTKLKIDTNPFAAGFTISGKANTKRKREEAELRQKQRLSNTGESSEQQQQQSDDELSIEDSKSYIREELLDDEYESLSDECNCPRPKSNQMTDDWCCLLHDNQALRRTSTSSDSSGSITFHRPWEARHSAGGSPPTRVPTQQISPELCESTARVQHSIHRPNPQLPPCKLESIPEQRSAFSPIPSYIHPAYSGFSPMHSKVAYVPPMPDLANQALYGPLLPVTQYCGQPLMYSHNVSPISASAWQAIPVGFPLTPPDTPKPDFLPTAGLAAMRPAESSLTLKRRNSQPAESVNSTKSQYICVDDEQANSPTSTQERRCVIPRKRWLSDSMIAV